MLRPQLEFVFAVLSGWISRHQQELIEYLQTENRALREQLGGRRLRFTDAQRRRLAKAAKKVGRAKLLEIDPIVPLELLEKLAALIPRPRINLLLYHGVLAPHARDRREASAYGRSSSDGVSSPSPNDSDCVTIDDEAACAVPDPEDQAAPAAAQSLAAKRAWANLMRRAFDLDVLACPACNHR